MPGLAAPDPFCSTWANYVGTLQALGTAASFGDLTSDRFAALELVAAPRLADDAAAIAAAWPAELAAERTIVVEQRIGPYARRAQRGVETLRHCWCQCRRAGDVERRVGRRAAGAAIRPRP